MSLIEKKIIDQIEILNNNVLQIREALIIEKEGQEIAKTYHRRVLSPGDDLTGENSKIVSIANLLWTEEVIKKYKEKLAENNISSPLPNLEQEINNI